MNGPRDPERSNRDDLAAEVAEAWHAGDLDVDPPDPSEYRDLERLTP